MIKEMCYPMIQETTKKMQNNENEYDNNQRDVVYFDVNNLRNGI